MPEKSTNSNGTAMHLMIISKLTLAFFDANYLTYRVFPISTCFTYEFGGDWIFFKKISGTVTGSDNTV